MFCYQCEQAAKGQGCTSMGVCGKTGETAKSQDSLTCAMIGLGDILEKKKLVSSEDVDLIVDGLFTTVTNVSFDEKKTYELEEKIIKRLELLGGSKQVKEEELFSGEENTTSLRSTLLFGLRGMAAYAHHARVLGKRDEGVDQWFIKGMAALGKEHTVDQWLSLLMEFGKVNLRCMEILDQANTGAYGNPVPSNVTMLIEKGPFIIVTGHDLHDLKMLLEQSEGKDVNIYTHSEMLPSHGYPELKKYTHLKGNFGTAWQNQQKEFEEVPAPILFTTNCLMPPKKSYSDRVYTTSVVEFPEIKHIDEDEKGQKDFSGLIEHAIELAGLKEDKEMFGINGGSMVTTGFGRQTVLDNAPEIIDAVKAGAIKHFFLVGGCDGAKPGRNYYTDFVKQTPEDTVILTLACGKFRFNDLNIGNIGPFPRILDMGQCNDAYGAIKVALALSEAFELDVNQLPLSLVLSWYEQKAVCILLTLLSLGIKNIYIGPTAPAFFSETVLNVFVEQFDIHLITTPENDLKEILG